MAPLRRPTTGWYWPECRALRNSASVVISSWNSVTNLPKPWREWASLPPVTGRPSIPGHFQGEFVFAVYGAAVGYLYGVGQLEYRMGQGVFRSFREFVGDGLVNEGAGAVPIPAEDAAEGVGGDYEPADGGGRLAQLGGLVEPGLVLVQSEGQHMPHVGFHFHGPYQDDAVQGREFLKFVAVPRPGVFGDAETAQPQPVGFQHHVLGGETAVAAALGGVYVQVEESGHGAMPPSYRLLSYMMLLL